MPKYFAFFYNQGICVSRRTSLLTVDEALSDPGFYKGEDLSAVNNHASAS